MRLYRALDRSRSHLPGPVRTALDWVLTIALAVVGVLAFQAEIAKPYRIPTASMEPTLHCARPGAGCEARFSDRVLANRVVYRLRDPKRFEIVVFRAPDAAETLCGAGGHYVKRIVGLPGERIEMRDGRVWVDGRLLDEPYLGTARRAGTASGTWQVPRGAYFLMGDNRTLSCDSRTWGSVARSRLIGPVLLTYWPPSRVHQGLS